MKWPATPFNEETRLKELDSLDIIDTLPEMEYDNITRIASIICNTPISLISLLDAKKQFFKSHLGLNSSETPREFAFCAHAINKPDELMVVGDSRKDERFSDNPLVINDPHVIFYAGMPLVTSEGNALGTLCVIDNKPRELSEEQKEAIRSLANQVILLLELRKKNGLLIKSQNEMASFATEMEAFAYAASHDLKEPLRTVKSFVNLLEKKYSTQLDDTGRRYIYHAVDGVNRMESLISELLEYSKAGKINKDKNETNINEIVEETKHLLKIAIAEKEATINSEGLPIIMMPRVAVRQVLQNLISNALKYQLENIKPVISIKARETETHCEFSVSDNGIGISEGDLTSVFTIFKRLNSKEKYSGTGIGLAICKKIVEQHGGEIWVESEEGKGSTFYFTMAKSNG